MSKNTQDCRNFWRVLSHNWANRKWLKTDTMSFLPKNVVNILCFKKFMKIKLQLVISTYNYSTRVLQRFIVTIFWSMSIATTNTDRTIWQKHCKQGYKVSSYCVHQYPNTNLLIRNKITYFSLLLLADILYDKNKWIKYENTQNWGIPESMVTV